MVANTAVIENSVLVGPCFIGDGVKVTNSVIGPYVSISGQSTVENSNIKNSVIQSSTSVSNAMFDNSMIGNHVKYDGHVSDISIGDYTDFKE